MALIKCPEVGCNADISTTALSCTRCGFQLQQYITNEFEPFLVGIPIEPLQYWYEHHLWHIWGQKMEPITYTDCAWVEKGDTLMSVSTIQLRSPFSGFVVSTSRVRAPVTVGALHSSARFIELRIRKGHFSQDIGMMFWGLKQCLNQAMIAQQYPDPLDRALSTLKLKDLIDIDPEKIFPSMQEFQRKADDLLGISAVKLELETS